MDDGVVWEKERWIGRFCWFVCCIPEMWGVGFSATFDDHPDSSHCAMITIGPFHAGAKIYAKEG